MPQSKLKSKDYIWTKIRKEFSFHVAELLIKYGCHEIYLSPYLEIEWIEKYPDLDWVWGTDPQNIYGYDYGKSLGKKESFDIYWVELYPDKPWNFNNDISMNPNLDISWIQKYPDQNWNWWTIGHSNNFNISWLEYLQNVLVDDFWNSLGFHERFSLDWVRKYPNCPWNWDSINKNFNFLRKFKIEYYEEFPLIPWNWILICKLAHDFDMEWPLKYPNLSWSFSQISKNKNLTLNWLHKIPYPYFQIKFKDNTNLVDKEWDTYYLAREKNIVYDRHNAKYSYRNPPLTFDDSRSDSTEKTSWDSASILQTDLEFIEDEEGIIMMDEIMNCDEKEYALCSRYYDKSYQRFKDKKIREWMASYKIQKWWLRIYYSPYTRVGRNMINKKYDEQYNYFSGN